jgi:hypothetical protein
MTLEIIYLRDVKTKALLPYKRLSSIKIWLTKNRVQIFGDKNCKRQYILKEQFERAQLQERIQNLKQIYGDNWMEVLKSEMQLRAKYQTAIDSIQYEKDNPVIKQQVKDQGNAERNFILDITKELKLR